MIKCVRASNASQTKMDLTFVEDRLGSSVCEATTPATTREPTSPNALRDCLLSISDMAAKITIGLSF